MFIYLGTITVKHVNLKRRNPHVRFNVCKLQIMFRLMLINKYVLFKSTTAFLKKISKHKQTIIKSSLCNSLF